ncbi:MAG: OmpA family protein, partial [Novosphingobium sp.]
KAAAKKAPAAKAPAKAAAAKPAAKAAAAPKKAAAAAKPAAAAKKVAASKKAAAPKKVATLKAAPAKLMDKAADVASDAGKTGAAAVAGTVAAVGAVGAAAVAAASGAADAAKDTASKAVGVAGDAAGAAAGAVTGAASAAADKAGALFSGGGQASASEDDGAGLGWIWWALGIALLVFALWWVFGRGNAEQASPSGVSTEAVAGADAGAAASGAAADLSAAPAEGSVAIPAGAGVTSELRDGKPVVKVYFDTAKTDVAPAFGAAAGGLKAWLDGHAGSKLAISGYSDPSGNAAANAEFSKKRAQAVQAALVSAGIPVEAAELVKPAESADASVPKEAARRVEVTVQ